MATKPNTPAEPVQAAPAKKDSALCRKKGCSNPIFTSERSRRRCSAKTTTGTPATGTKR